MPGCPFPSNDNAKSRAIPFRSRLGGLLSCYRQNAARPAAGSYRALHLRSVAASQFLADSFIVLELEDVGKGLRRSILIRKMRYTDHDAERHPFIIRKGGIQVMHEEEIY